MRQTTRHAVRLGLAGALLVLLCACTPTEYVIPAGKHSSTARVEVVTGATLWFEATFDGSAVYETVDPVNQADINKLYGFSDCTSHHHQNSARFGWRWYGGRLEIHAYTYVGGERRSQKMGDVGIGETHLYGIELDGDRYVFTLDDTTITMPRGCDGGGGARYKLFPYFGGDEVAPHEIRITVEEL